MTGMSHLGACGGRKKKQETVRAQMTPCWKRMGWQWTLLIVQHLPYHTNANTGTSSCFPRDQFHSFDPLRANLPTRP